VKYQVIQKELQKYKGNRRNGVGVAVQTEECIHVVQSHHSSQTSPSPTLVVADASTMTHGLNQPTVEKSLTSTSLASSCSSSLGCDNKKNLLQESVSIGHVIHSKLSFSKHTRSYSDGHRLLTWCPARENLNKLSEPKLLDRSCHSEEEVKQELPLAKPESVMQVKKSITSSEIRKHKCVWQKEVKTLQIKLRSLRKQV